MDGDKHLRGAVTDIERQDFLMSNEEREHELATALDNHAHMADEWWNGNVSYQQAQGLAYYLDGSPSAVTYYGDTGTEGTISGAVSRDVAEIVDWLMPDLKRVLTANENYFEFRDQTNPEQASINTQVANMVMEEQGELDTELDNWIKNGLLMKVGIMHVYPVDPLPEVQEFDGLSIIEIKDILARNPAIEENESKRSRSRTTNIGRYPDGFVYSGMFERHLPRRLVIETVPPEDFLVSNDVDRLSQEGGMGPAYVGRRFRGRTVAELMTIWPEHADKIKEVAEEGDSQTGYSDSASSYIGSVRDNNSSGETTKDFDESNNIHMRRISIYEEWYRFDWDKDGIPELRYIVRAGKNRILVNETARDNPFAVWQPHPLPHRLYGESLAEKIMMLQDCTTSLLRAFLDSANLGARPRIAFDADRADELGLPTLNDILDWDPGSAIRCPGNPAETLMEINVGQNSAKSAIEGMTYLAELKAAWSGVSKQQQGLNPEKLSRVPKAGADAVSQAGNGRKEYLARRLAVGMEELAKKIIACANQYLSEPFVVTVGGEMVPVQPSSLMVRMQAKVHVSGSLGNRDKEIENLMMCLTAQQNFIGTFGPSNPFIGIKEVANAIGELMNAYGFKDSGRFIRQANDQEMQQYMEQMQSQEDPTITAKKIEAQSQTEQVKMTESMNKYRLDTTGAIDKAKLKIDAADNEAERKSRERMEILQQETSLAIAKINAASSEFCCKQKAKQAEEKSKEKEAA